MMFRKLLLLLVILCICFQVYADVWVNGYTRKDGTRVSGHWRSNPDGIFSNNWSTYGNINPHTGEIGRKTISPNLNVKLNQISTLSTNNIKNTSTNYQSSSNNASIILTNWTNDLRQQMIELSPNFENPTFRDEYLQWKLDKYTTLANKRNRSREETAEMFRFKVEIKEDGAASSLEEIDSIIAERRKVESQNNGLDTGLATLVFIIFFALLLIPFHTKKKK